MVNGFVKVFHEDVSKTGFSKGRISLGPHDSARLSTNADEVHGVERTFSSIQQ